MFFLMVRVVKGMPMVLPKELTLLQKWAGVVW